MKASLTIVIPTLNNVKGINYLRGYFKNKLYKVIVVDNSKKNLGFAGGVNKGSRMVDSKWQLVLNDDIEFGNMQNTIQKLIEFAEKKKLDAVSPILRNPDGKVENYGYKLLPIGKVHLIKEFPNTKYEILNTDLDGITAACLLIKTSVFKKLRGFDESFFAYLEDVDFFIRFKKSGYKMGIAPVEVLHNHMTTSKTMGNFKARQDMINWWRLYIKHPDRFKFDIHFLIERVRNISGYLKSSIKSLLSSI